MPPNTVSRYLSWINKINADHQPALEQERFADQRHRGKAFIGKTHEQRGSMKDQTARQGQRRQLGRRVLAKDEIEIARRGEEINHRGQLDQDCFHRAAIIIG